MDIFYYVEKGWGTYQDLINLSIRDFLEIKVGIESRIQQEKLEKAIN